MFRLDNLLERWTEIYDKMQHNPSATAKPEEKAFFLIDLWAEQSEFQRTFNLLTKPSLIYCTNVDAGLSANNPKQVEYQYKWYLACKQRPSGSPLTDDQGGQLAKIELDDIVLDLLAFINTLADAANGRTLPSDTPQSVLAIIQALTKEDIQGLRGLRLGQTQWWSNPAYRNGWWIMGMETKGINPRQLCIIPSHYI